MSSPSGLRRASYEYDPFGNITSMEGNVVESNPFRFSSEYHDEDLGLVYYNYQHYNPTDGRCISRDPIAEHGGYHLYAFVANNSLIFNNQLSIGTDANSVMITVDRWYAVKDVGVYSLITVRIPYFSLPEKDPDCALCAQFSGKKLNFYGIESYEVWWRYHYNRSKQGPGKGYNYFDPNKTIQDGDFSTISRDKPKSGRGFTSILGRYKRGLDAVFELLMPGQPECMSDRAYEIITRYEAHTNDGGDNFHAGRKAEYHSTGCFIIGTQFVDEGFNYQDSLQEDFLFKTALYCAVKRAGKKMYTRANNTMIVEDAFDADMYPVLINNIQL